MAGIMDGLLQYRNYGGPGHSGDYLGLDPFTLEDKNREYVLLPADALDWIFFWHDVRYSIARLKGGKAEDYRLADSQLLKDLQALDAGLISQGLAEGVRS